MTFGCNDQHAADSIFLKTAIYVACLVKLWLGANSDFGEQISGGRSNKAMGNGNFCASEGGHRVIYIHQYLMASACAP
jgi:hypothetical protein